jgi:AraC-like DNA-binding protein
MERDLHSVAGPYEPTVTTFAIRQALGALHRHGVPAEPLVERAGLAGVNLRDPQTRVSAGRQGRFLELTAEALGDASFGLHLAVGTNPREMGLLYYVTSSPKRLRDALSLFLSYSKIINESLILSSNPVGDRFAVEFELSGVAAQDVRVNTEFWAALSVRAMRQFSGRQLSPVSVRFPHFGLGDSRRFAQFFGCPVEFGGATGRFVFLNEVLDLPLVTEDPHLLEIMKPLCDEAAKGRKTAKTAFRTAVEAEIQRLLPEGQAALGPVANRLSLSSRTVCRKLADEGTSFSDVLQGLRRNLALAYVNDDSIPLTQVAWLLGYEAPTSFTHAFRRWTGESPLTYRRAKIGRKAIRA